MARRPDVGSRFRTTSWTLVIDAREDPAALEQLLTRYWSPVYAFYRRLGESPDAAADLTQGFLTKVISDRRVLEHASPERGRFRSFLAQALRNYRIDELRAVAGRNLDRPRTFLPADDSAFDRAEPNPGDDALGAFEREWATRTLAVAVERLEHVCRASDLERHWTVFHARVLAPLLHGAEPRSIDDLVELVAARDAAEVSSMLHSVKRKLRTVLREVVAETVASEADVDEELAALKRYM